LVGLELCWLTNWAIAPFSYLDFAKNEKDNIDSRELAALKQLGAVLLSLSPV